MAEVAVNSEREAADLRSWRDYMRSLDDGFGHFPPSYDAFAAGVAYGIERSALVAEADDTWEGDHIAEKIRGDA